LKVEELDALLTRAVKLDVFGTKMLVEQSSQSYREVE
jgi:hypothetical protein